jgi:hypothetical protein
LYIEARSRKDVKTGRWRDYLFFRHTFKHVNIT